MRVLDVQLRTVRVRAQQRFFVFLNFGEIHRGCEFLISAFSNENSILLSLNLPPFGSEVTGGPASRVVVPPVVLAQKILQLG
ncbi:MAG TPA: hypothetical protein VF492_09635, partial [Verrucomicrobiae bacterium]